MMLHEMIAVTRRSSHEERGLKFTHKEAGLFAPARRSSHEERGLKLRH